MYQQSFGNEAFEAASAVGTQALPMQPIQVAVMLVSAATAPMAQMAQPQQMVFAAPEGTQGMTMMAVQPMQAVMQPLMMQPVMMMQPQMQMVQMPVQPMPMQLQQLQVPPQYPAGFEVEEFPAGSPHMGPKNTTSMMSCASTQSGDLEALDDAETLELPASKLSSSAQRRRRRQRAAAERAAEGSPAQSSANIERPRGSGRQNQGPAHPFSDEEILEMKDDLENGKPIEEVLRKVQGNVWGLSRDGQGCRLVQQLMDKLSTDAFVRLAHELRTHVWDAIASPHANYVVQKIISGLPSGLSTFLVEELAGQGPRMARHRFGCRIICRLLEHCSREAATNALLDHILIEAGDLCQHTYGHHVVQSILEHGALKHKRALTDALLEYPVYYSEHRSASYVVEKVLNAGEDLAEERMRLINSLGSPATVAQLATSQFGCYVVAALLKIPEVATAETLRLIEAHADQIRTTRHGVRLLKELGMATEEELLALEANLAESSDEA